MGIIKGGPSLIRVLVVDDEPGLLEVTAEFLQLSGDLEVSTAPSGPRALELLQGGSFDAVVSDYQMPGMDGIELLKRVRERDAGIPFILFTGRGRGEVAIAAIDAGVTFYLQKGGDVTSQFAELEHKVRKAVAHRRAEDSLLLAEFSVQSSSLPTYWFSPDGSIERVNQAACDALGYTKEELLTCFVWDIDPSLNREKWSQVWDRLTAAGRRVLHTLQRRRDGTVFDAEVHISIMRFRDREYGFAFARDISGQLRREAQLREIESRFRLITENSIDGIWISDLNFNLVYVSPAVSRIRGYSEKELLSLPIDRQVTPASLMHIRRVMAEELVPHKLMDPECVISRTLELEFLNKDGSVTISEEMATLIRGPDGEPIGFLGIGRDVTERERLATTLTGLAESSPLGYVILDRGGQNILFYNSKFTELWGLESGKRMGVDEVQALVSAQVRDPDKLKQTCFGNNEVQEDLLELRDGRTFRHFSAPIVDTLGRQFGRLCSFEDVTEEKRQEALLVIQRDLRIELEQARSTDEAIGSIIRIACRIEGVDCGAIFEIRDSRPWLTAQKGLSPEMTAGLFSLPDDSPHHRMLADGQPVFARFEGRLDVVDPSLKGLRAVAMVPLISERQVIGYMNLASRTVDEFTWHSRRIIEAVAAQAAAMLARVRLEEDLRASRENLRLFFDRVDYLMGVVSEDGIILEVNRAAMDKLRTTRERLVGLDVRAARTPNSARVLELISKVADRGSDTVIIPLYTNKGEMLEAEAQVVRGVWDGQRAFFVIAQDITEKMRAEQTLRESEERFREMFERSPLGIELYDAHGCLVEANPACLRIFGVRDQSTVEGFNLFTDPNLTPDIRERLERGESAVFQQLFDFDLVRKNGLYPTEREGTIRLETVITPLRTRERVSGYLVQVDDITERERAMEAVRESEGRFRQLFDSVADAIFIHRLDGGFLEANQVACKRLGYSREEMLGMRPQDIDVPPMAALVPQRIQELLTAGVALFETVHVAKDGLKIPTEINCRLIDYKGSLAVLSVARDITERKEAENGLAEANRKLAMLNELTRHDLLNQLTVLAGSIALAREGNREAYLDRAERSINSMNRLLQFARQFQGLGSTAPEWQAADRVVAKAAAALDLRDVELHPDLRGVEVFADPMLEKAFYNLLENTLRHGEGARNMWLRHRLDDRTLVIEYSDDGKGIAPAMRGRLFKKGQGSNTGLGLFMIRNILSVTGIEISETGSSGRGVRFEIRVPEGRYRVPSLGGTAGGRTEGATTGPER